MFASVLWPVGLLFFQNLSFKKGFERWYEEGRGLINKDAIKRTPLEFDLFSIRECLKKLAPLWKCQSRHCPWLTIDIKTPKLGDKNFCCPVNKSCYDNGSALRKHVCKIHVLLFFTSQIFLQAISLGIFFPYYVANSL